MENFLWGMWNGFSADLLLMVHFIDWVLGTQWLSQFPIFNPARIWSGLYQFGFLFGVGLSAGCCEAAWNW